MMVRTTPGRTLVKSGGDTPETEGIHHGQSTTAQQIELCGILPSAGHCGSGSVRHVPQRYPVNSDRRGSETAPISTLSQDLTVHGYRLATRGVCSCEPPTTFTDCTCHWGALVRRMLYVGYSQPLDQAAHDLLPLSENARDVILNQREVTYRRLVAAFQGSVLEFCAAHGLSRAVFYRLGLRVKSTP